MGRNDCFAAEKKGCILHPQIQTVLFAGFEHLRADAVGAYGASTGATPVLDRLGRGGLVFRQAHAHNVVTLPSHANILAGRYPLEHGVRDNASFRFPADMDTLATLLRARGWPVPVL